MRFGRHDRSVTSWAASRFTPGLVVIAVCALAVRIAYVFVLVHPASFSGDPVYYHEQANLLAEGQGFIEPFRWLATGEARATAYHPPLYPLVLAVSSAAGLDSWRAHQLVTCVLGVATVALAGVLGRRVAGPAAGLLAAAVAAVYPFLWLNDGLVMAETLAALTTTIVLVVTYAARRDSDWRRLVALGGVCGLAILARGETVLLLPLVALPVAAGGRGIAPARRFARAGIVGLAALAVVAPWLVRNAMTFEGRVIVSSNDGTTVFLANCPSTYDPASFHYGAWDFWCPTHERPPDEGVASQQMLHEGFAYMTAHLDDVPGVMWARLGRVWGLFRPAEQIRRDGVEGRSPAWSWLGSGLYYVQLPLAVLGVLDLRRRRESVWPLVAPGVIVTVVALAFYGTTRFRILAEVPLVVLAAAGVVALSGGRARATAAGAPAARASAPAKVDHGEGC